jgi:hypothetical protein
MTTEESLKRNDRLNELKEHAVELREFEDSDWDGTREDLELLWDLREALSRSVEKGELEEVSSEPAKESGLHESYELPARDAELLLAEVAADPLETNVDQKEKTENAERSL